MEKYPFIFSDRKRYRFQRHFVFWFSWWLFATFLYSFSAGLLDADYARRLPVAGIESALYLAPHMFLSYSLLYYVIPMYLLKGRYIQAAGVVLGLFVVTAAISTFTSIFLVAPLRGAIFGTAKVPPHLYEVNFFLGLLSGLRGGITVGGIAAAIKLTKYWYMKEQRNLQLQKENITSQLALLKSQVHPHFLFNTLNNIYSGTQVTSPEAAKMIIGLSQLLRYMLYECNQPLVPLSKELKMLEEYIHLERSRYGNDLDISLELPTETEGLSIAPLLLLPFVENCFKHGTSNMLEQPWVSLHITVEGEWLKMKLMNGKSEEEPSRPHGIGLSNAVKRLDLLYPQKHDLVINNEEEVFIVNLKLLLDRKSLSTAPAVAEPNPEVYA